MPTAVESPKTHAVPTDHIRRLEKKALEMGLAFDDLPDDTATSELLKYIHRPGFTTPAEFVFLEAMMETVIAQSRLITQITKQITSGAAIVGRD